MQYQITLSNMDSPQALNLVRSSLEKKFHAVEVSEASNIVYFENQADLETTRLTVDDIFAEYLKSAGIEYCELIKIDY